MRREASTPDDYLDRLGGWRHEKVSRLREIVLASAPGVRESLRAGFLYYDDGGDLFAIAAQKHHVALYVFDPEAMAAARASLEGLDCGKGCIRFRAATEIPATVIGGLLGAAAASATRDCGKG